MPLDQRDGNDYREFWAALKRGQFQMAEFKRTAKDGHEVWIEASYNPVLDKTGKAVTVLKLATDITNKKMRGLVDAAKIAAVDRSQATIKFKLDSTIVAANENFLRTLGYANTMASDIVPARWLWRKPEAAQNP